MPLSSRHSRLDYWLLLHVCRSRLTTFSLSLVFTSLVIDKSDLSCSRSFFKSESSFLIPASVVSNLLWSSRARLMISSFEGRFRKCHDNQQILLTVRYFSVLPTKASARYGNFLQQNNNNIILFSKSMIQNINENLLVFSLCYFYGIFKIIRNLKFVRLILRLMYCHASTVNQI